MKRLLFILISGTLIIIGIVFIVRVNNSKPSDTLPTTSHVPSKEEIEPMKTHLKELTFNAITYAYDTFEIEDTSKLQLLGNFKEKMTSKQLMEDNNCIFSVNAGFYSTSNTPLGLFVGENYKQPIPLDSALFNGFFSFTDTKGSITSESPDTYRAALQTGPLLRLHGKQQLLSINNDTPERRVIAGVTKEGHILFIVIFIKDSLYQGPLLGNLPELISQINQSLPSPIQDAINLDGGSASAFISPYTTVQELTSLGSIFCLTK